MSMEDLFPPLVNKPNPMDDPAAPAFGRRGHVEPYEAEDDPDFSYDGFQVTRREYYAHNNEPAISFSDGRLGINAVCLKKAPDVEYVQILVNREKKKLVIRPGTEDDWDSFMWCTRSHKSKSITCRMFFAMIIDMMGWDPASRYRVIGKMIRHKDEYLFVFELASGQEFKREIVVDTEGKERRKTSRTPIYNSEWKGQFGRPVEEHKKAVQINIFDGFAVYGMKDSPETKQ